MTTNLVPKGAAARTPAPPHAALKGGVPGARPTPRPGKAGRAKADDRLRAVFLGLARSKFSHLTMRQLGALYLTETSQTVRGLAADFDCPKPSITRALQKLDEMGLVERTVDAGDLRSNNNVRTRPGDELVALIASF